MRDGARQKPERLDDSVCRGRVHGSEVLLEVHDRRQEFFRVKVRGGEI